MAVSTQATQQVLEAMNWSFGGRECRSTLFVDDVALSLEDEYYDFNVINESGVEEQFYVWLDGGTGTDPLVAGKTAIPVVYVSGDSKEAIAILASAAITAATDAKEVSNVAGLLVMENSFLGLVTVEDYTNAPSLTLEVLAAGFGGDIGAVAKGGASVSTEQSLEDIMSDQTGDLILDQIIKGASVSLEMTIAEMSDSNWTNLVGKGSGDILALASDLVGYGQSKLYNSSFSNAGQLTGHPIRLATSDRSADVTIFKTMPNMNNINYSGDEVQGGEFAFTALLDGSKDSKINLFARGDHSLV